MLCCRFWISDSCRPDFPDQGLQATCVTMHKSMQLTSVGDCLYSMICCSEGLEANPELESWIPTSPQLSPTWWTLLREFNNFYHYLMTDKFHWDVPGKGGAKGRELQRLRAALPGSIGSERKMGADIWMALQAMFQLNMQKRKPPMMPGGLVMICIVGLGLQPTLRPFQGQP
jgi:hypothetical protein